MSAAPKKQEKKHKQNNRTLRSDLHFKRKPWNSYRDLKIWGNAMDIAREVYALTDEIPKSEHLGLAEQMRRVAVSVPSTIAEGYCRYDRSEFTGFLSFAMGALAELETQLELTRKLGYIENDETCKKMICSEREMILKICKHKLHDSLEDSSEDQTPKVQTMSDIEKNKRSAL